MGGLAERALKVQAHLEDGKRESRAWHVPDAALCQKLAEHHCKTQEHLAACTASFAADGQATPLALFGAVAPAPTPVAEPEKPQH